MHKSVRKLATLFCESVRKMEVSTKYLDTKVQNIALLLFSYGHISFLGFPAFVWQDSSFISNSFYIINMKQ